MALILPPLCFLYLYFKTSFQHYVILLLQMLIKLSLIQYKFLVIGHIYIKMIVQKYISIISIPIKYTSMGYFLQNRLHHFFLTHLIWLDLPSSRLLQIHMECTRDQICPKRKQKLSELLMLAQEGLDSIQGSMGNL